MWCVGPRDTFVKLGCSGVSSTGSLRPCSVYLSLGHPGHEKLVVFPTTLAIQDTVQQVGLVQSGTCNPLFYISPSPRSPLNTWRSAKAKGESMSWDPVMCKAVDWEFTVLVISCHPHHNSMQWTLLDLISWRKSTKIRASGIFSLSSLLTIFSQFLASLRFDSEIPEC